MGDPRNSFGNYNQLGNYVHFKYRNYQKFGYYWQGRRQKEKEKNEEDGKRHYKDQNISAYQQYKYNHTRTQELQDEKFFNKIEMKDKKNITELKRRLRYYSKPAEDKDSQKLKNEKEEMRKAVLQVLERLVDIRAIGHALNNIEKNIDTFGDFNIDEYKAQKASNFNKPNFKEFIKRVEEKYKDLIIKTNTFNNFVSQEEIQDFINDWNVLIKEFNIPKLTDEAIIQNVAEADTQSIIGKVKQYLAVFNYASTVAELKGTYGETLTLMVSDEIWNQANKTSSDFLAAVFKAGGLKGDIKTPFNLRSGSLIGGKSLESIDEMKNTFRTWSNAKDKIDVSITINGEELPASVKYYKDMNDKVRQTFGIKGQGGGIPLLTMLSTMNEELDHFGTHWMNFHTATAVTGKGSKKIDTILKKQLIYESFAYGNPLKRKSGNTEAAKVLVLFEYSTGKVDVISIKNMIDNPNYVTITPSNIENIQIENRDFAKKVKKASNNEIKQRLINNILQLNKEKRFYVKYNVSKTKAFKKS